MTTDSTTRNHDLQPPFKRRWWQHLLKFAVFGALALSVLGGVVMLLWNWLIPNLFHGPTLTLLQAIGLLALCRLLFGSLRPHGMRHRGMRRAGWRHQMQQRWQAMTPEEREKVRHHLRGKWCC